MCIFHIIVLVKMVGVAERSENRYRSQDMLYGCLCIYTSDARNRAPV